VSDPGHGRNDEKSVTQQKPMYAARRHNKEKEKRTIEARDSEKKKTEQSTERLSETSSSAREAARGPKKAGIQG